MSCGLLFDCQCGTFSSHENTMANLWHPLRGVQISNLGGKCNIFKFFHEVDIVQMKNGAPGRGNEEFLEDLGAIGCPKSAEEEEEINYRQGIRHGNSFCPVLLNHEGKEMQLGWDVTTR
ncbi:hypothetical protein Gotur_001038 [Gossypium turneri]